MPFSFWICSSNVEKIQQAWIGLAICPAAARVSRGLVPKSMIGSNPHSIMTSLGWMCLRMHSWLSVGQDLTKHPNNPFSRRRWAESPARRHPHWQAKTCDPHEWSAHGAQPSMLRRYLLKPPVSVPKASCSISFKDKASSSEMSHGRIFGITCRTLVTTCNFGQSYNWVLPIKGEVRSHHARERLIGQISCKL